MPISAPYLPDSDDRNREEKDRRRNSTEIVSLVGMEGASVAARWWCPRCLAGHQLVNPDVEIRYISAMQEAIFVTS